MMTKEQYIESLRKLHLNLYMFGKKIENPVDDPVIRPSLNSFAATYELAEDPQYEDLMTATSHISGKKINRFTHMHQSTDDLIKKVKMQRLLGQKTAACFQRCVGMDAMNAVFSSTYEIDEACGTKYHENFLKFLTRVQDEDLAVDGAMTDVKGDRSLAPSKQADPDLFLHVVERTPDGVYVTGAKAHQTGFVNSHEVLVMPTISMREGDEDYAISFAVPTEDRMRLLRLIENMTMGTAAVGYLPESMHGAGSPQAQRIMIARQSNLEMKKELAKKIARIQ